MINEIIIGKRKYVPKQDWLKILKELERAKKAKVKAEAEKAKWYERFDAECAESLKYYGEAERSKREVVRYKRLCRDWDGFKRKTVFLSGDYEFGSAKDKRQFDKLFVVVKLKPDSLPPVVVDIK